MKSLIQTGYAYEQPATSLTNESFIFIYRHQQLCHFQKIKISVK